MLDDDRELPVKEEVLPLGKEDREMEPESKVELEGFSFGLELEVLVLIAGGASELLIGAMAAGAASAELFDPAFT